MEALLSFVAVLALYAVAAELAARRGSGTEQDYLVAGRQSGRLLVALSAGAAASSGFVVIGAVGSGYALGIVGVLIPLAWFFGDLLFWLLFPARINRTAATTGCNTVPALLAVTVRTPSRLPVRTVAALCIVVFVGLYAAAQLLAAGKTLNALLDIPLTWGVVLSAVTVLVYCGRGGLRASVWTNALQAVAMLLVTVGMLVVITIACGGPSEAFAQVAARHPELLDPLTVTGTWGLLFVFLLGFAAAAVGFDLSTPQLLVRIMSGRNDAEAAGARWYYLAFMQITWIAMALFGMLARLVLPDLADPEQALPVYARTLLPAWITGLVVAGMFSAIVSTLEGQILAISSSLAVDIAPAVHDRLLRRMGARLDQLVTALVAMLLALLTLGLSTTVFDLIVFSANALSAAFAPVMLVVLFRWRTSSAALKTAMLAGMLVAVCWRLAGWHAVMIEALPGMVAGLLAHALMVRPWSRAPAADTDTP